jgi:hypothetical protein
MTFKDLPSQAPKPRSEFLGARTILKPIFDSCDWLAWILEHQHIFEGTGTRAGVRSSRSAAQPVSNALAVITKENSVDVEVMER